MNVFSLALLNAVMQLCEYILSVYLNFQEKIKYASDYIGS